MAVPLVGSTDASGTGIYNELQFARMGSVGSEAQVVNGGDLVPSLGAGTREVVVGGGWVKCCNGFAGSSGFVGSTSVFLAANGGANARRDWVVAEFNWNNTATGLGTPGNSVSIQVKQGGSGGADPALTQTPGDVWMVPLAVGIVPSGGGGAVNLLDARPTRPKLLSYRDTPAVPPDPAATMAAATTDPKVLATIPVPFVPWPHRLRVYAHEKFAHLNGSGFGRLSITIDGTQPNEGEDRAPEKNDGTATVYYISGPRPPGEATVRMRMDPQQMAGEPLVTTAGYSAFTVEVEPI